jgi:small acid-soluble spore protein D (minor alpha/beta-type SASP)
MIVTLSYGGECEVAKNDNGRKNLVPNAKPNLDKYKYEVASQMGVNLKPGYNGDLTSREAGSVGGNMVKKMVQKAEQDMANGPKPGV